MIKAELIFRINRLLGREVVESIEFRIDPAVIDHARVAAPPQRARTESRRPVPAELVSAASSIGDEDLRRRFLRAAENCIERRDPNPIMSD